MHFLNLKTSSRTAGCHGIFLIISIKILIWGQVTSLPLDCSMSQQSFEIVTGFVFTAPDDTIELVPGTLHLVECLSMCRQNTTCLSVNYETGLCVLFSSSATSKPDALTPSQFPVFTIYAQKICLEELTCKREWIFERVSKHELLERSRKIVPGVERIEKCMELCLKESQFECRSANFHLQRKECQMSDVDRHSVQTNIQKHFVPAEEGTDYIENNCVDPPVRLCEFRKLNGKILKTVDAVFQEVKTLEGCRKKCLGVDYRCQSFDLGDPTNSVCRLSHLASPSLVDIEDPYLEIHGAATYEIASCYNVTIECRSREMVAYVRTTKVFNGKVYVKSRPNSCVTDVLNSMDFEIRMAYHDLNCDVKQQGNSRFANDIVSQQDEMIIRNEDLQSLITTTLIHSEGGNSQFANDIVIQHHDMIVTNQDLGVTVHCQYDLTNKSVAHGVRLEVNNEFNHFSTHSVNVGAPNVSMKVADRLGRDLFTAQVGDPLLLLFQITDHNSPYDIFVRELVAMDGIDNSEILLIDALGCPTDPLIMGSVSKSRDNGKILQASFDAFKFPTSEIVQFKALVTPCLPSCEPADCAVHSSDGVSQRMTSFGKKKRKKRSYIRQKRASEEEDEVVVVQTIHITDKFGFDRERRTMTSRDDATRTYVENEEEDEVVVVQTIHITDKYGFDRERRTMTSRDDATRTYVESDDSSSPTCLNIAGLVIASSLFLVAQLVVLLAWAFVWHKRMRTKSPIEKETSRSIDMIYNSRRDSSFGTSCGIDNPYRTDISPYDTVYNNSNSQNQNLSRRY